MYEAEWLSDVLDNLTVTMGRTCSMLTTLFDSIANSALSEVSSDRSNGTSNDRTLSTFFEGIFFPLWEFCMNLKIYLTPEHDPLENNGETQFNEEKKYTILISKEGKIPEVKSEEPDHVQPVSDPGNLIIGLSPKRGNGRYRLRVLSLNDFDNDGQLIGALRRVRKRCPFSLSTVTEIRVARVRQGCSHNCI